MKKAQYFITCRELPPKTIHEMSPNFIKNLFISKPKSNPRNLQLNIPFDSAE